VGNGGAFYVFYWGGWVVPDSAAENHLFARAVREGLDGRCHSDDFSILNPGTAAVPFSNESVVTEWIGVEPKYSLVYFSGGICDGSVSVDFEGGFPGQLNVVIFLVGEEHICFGGLFGRYGDSLDGVRWGGCELKEGEIFFWKFPPRPGYFLPRGDGVCLSAEGQLRSIGLFKHMGGCESFFFPYEGSEPPFFFIVAVGFNDPYGFWGFWGLGRELDGFPGYEHKGKE